MPIDSSSSVSAFTEFFTTVYRGKIDTLSLKYPTEKSLNVDFADLEKFDPELADALVKIPDVIVEGAETAIKQLNITISAEITFAPKVRFFGVPADDKLIEQLSSKNINELVAFKCVVTKRAEVMHRVKVAVYICQLCDSKMKVFVGKNFSPPKKCEDCKKIALKQLEDESTFVDIQRGEVQELLERVKGGAPTARIEVVMEEDLVNKIAPGDNITITGILRIRPPVKTRQKDEMIYARYVEVNSIMNLKRDFEEVEMTKADEKKILELSKKPDIADTIINSLAPSIYGHFEVKKAIMLQLFGGTRGKTMRGGMPIRADIHLLLIGDPGIAKCVTGDSEIILADGSIEQIGSFVDRRLTINNELDREGKYSKISQNVVSMDLDGKSGKKNATIGWKLKSPEYLYEIETQSGKKITVTPTHPLFLTKDGNIYSKKAMEIKRGEFIATPHRLRIEGKKQKLPKKTDGETNANKARLPEYLNSEFARMIGYLTGDGYFRRTTNYEISLTNEDKELLDDFEGIMKSFNLKTTTRFKGKTGVSCAFSLELGKILEEMGLIRNSFDKKVPNEILRSENEVVQNFLKSYIDCQANIRKEGIMVVSASKKLLNGVQTALLRFGIISTVHNTYSRATNSKTHKKTKYYRLFISGEQAKNYFKKIGFISKRKKEALKLIPETSNTNLDIIPELSGILKSMRKELKLTQFQMGISRTTYQHFERGDRNPSYNTLRKIVKKLKNTENEKLSILEKISESDIFWDKIKIIKKTKSKEKWVYDLQVDETHNFVSNNIYVHNSRFLQSISEIAPKSIYVSGKSVSGAGLCVDGESLIVLNDQGICEIGKYVEQHFKNGKEELKGAFSSKMQTKIAGTNADLKTEYVGSDKIWKIKAPKKMFRLITRRGKELKLTHNTRVITIEKGKPCWKKPSEIKAGDYIATSKTIRPLEGQKIPILNLIKNKNLRIISPDFIKITNNIQKKFGTLTQACEILSIDRERLYINRCNNQGIKLELFKKMVKLAELDCTKIEPGRIFLRHGRNHKLPRLLDENICYFAGLIAGDGDIHLKGNQGVVGFHSTNEELLLKAKKIVEETFGCKVRINRDGIGIPNIMISSVTIAELLNSLGVPAGEKSANIDINEVLGSAGEKCVRGYIRGLYDADGWVDERKTRGSSTIGFCTCSKKLARKLQLFLEWWGIIAKMRIRTDKIGKINGKEVISKKAQYYVEITGIENILKFQEKIGFLNMEKKIKLVKLVKKSNPKSNPNLDMIPINQLLKRIKRKFGISSEKIGNAYVYGLANPTQKKLVQIIKHIPESQEKEMLEILAKSDIYWDTLERIEEIKSETEWVYDLTVPGSHNFLANGIVVHNTVSAEKDELGDGGWTLKAGALVLASGGIAQVDEFDKIEEEDRATLHEAMESQSISVAKAGIVAKFSTKTAILAAANPKYGRFDTNKNLAEQFDIPPTLLSRFDLIFAILDVLDEEKDSKLADHILATHMGTDKVEAETFDRELLRKYIAYARRKVYPKLTGPASEKIKQYYVDLRGKGKEAGAVAITPRYLEGLVRLAEANAKMRLSETVDESDSEVAISLMNYVMQQIMTDKSTGLFDVDVVATGKPKSERDKMQKADTILDIIREHLRKSDSAEVEAVIKDAKSYEIEENEAKKIINELLRRGAIYEKEYGHVKIVGE